MANKEAMHNPDEPLTQEELVNISDYLGIKLVSAKEKARPSSIALLGEPKKGKTWLASSICKVPGYERVLLIDTEDGAAAISHDFPEVTVASLGQNPDTMLENFSTIINEIAGGGELLSHFDVIIVDTLNTLQELKRDQLIEMSKEKAATYHVWGELNKWTLRVAWALHRAPVLGIFNLHVKLAEEGNSGKSVLLPALQSAAKEKFGSIPDVVGYLSVEEDDEGRYRVLDVLPGKRIQAGSRFEHVLNERIDDPTMSKIYKLIDNA